MIAVMAAVDAVFVVARYRNCCWERLMVALVAVAKIYKNRKMKYNAYICIHISILCIVSRRHINSIRLHCHSMLSSVLHLKLLH